MKSRNFKPDRHAAYAQRKRDKAAARRAEYVKERNMLAYGQKRDHSLIELWQPLPISRHTTGIKYRPGGLLARAV